jgi:hypothetical protein
MTAFFEHLGAKITDRWFANLLLPGLLWLGCAVAAVQLGWRHAVDPRAAESLVRGLAADQSAAQGVVFVVGSLGVSAVIGLAAAGLATVLRRAWMLPGDVVPAKWLRQLRRRRWEAVDRVAQRLGTDVLRTADQAAGTAGPEYARALARRDSIGLERPERPTWIGDRWRATSIRVYRAYGLDLTIVWPRLWTLLPDAQRNDIAAAQLAFKESSSIVSWAVLYGLVGLFWGPSLIIAAGLAVTGVLQARDATANLCELVESACDLYGHSLAEQLHISCEGAMTPETGRAVNKRLRKDPPPAPEGPPLE